jgi:hypothetical protein
MRNRILLGTLIILASTAGAIAQPVGAGVSIGELPFGQVIFALGSSLGPSTLIDLTQPASSAGSLTSATVRWIGTATPCANAFKIKILRASVSGQLGTYTVVAERGPFSTPNFVSDTTVTLSPPIAVQAGDLLAVTQMNPTSGTCGFVGISRSDSTHSGIRMTGEVQSATPAIGNINPGIQINARASGDLPVLVGVVPAVGSLQGGFGSFFRTSIQIASGGITSQAVSGRLVFHPSGHPGSASDPGVGFLLQARDTVEFDDIGSTLHISGLGTLDILSTGVLPLVTVRVFNDNGAAGTQGFVEPVVRPRDAALTNAQVFLSQPHDPTNFRMNIGVRTLDLGATLLVINIAKDGQSAGTVATKTYPANYFEQVGLQQFLDNLPPSPDGLLAINVTAGSAVIYGSTTDNRTNDSAVTIATRP